MTILGLTKVIQVSISIVTYNSSSVIENCINSIFENTKDLTFEIILIDNCSEDNTAQIINEKFPNITFIQNTKNVGFGKAHNQTFKISKGKYFLILNPDTILFPMAINKVLDFMERNPDAGLTGCKIWWDDEKNFMFPDLPLHNLKTALLYFTPLCHFFPNNPLIKSHWQSAYTMWNATRPIEVKGVTGGFMMVRKGLFEKVGGFDENFFLFFEEHDLQRRIKKLGYKIYYIPDAEIQHYFEESCRNSSIDIGSIYRKSAIYYYKKYYNILGNFLIKFCFLINQIFTDIVKIFKINKSYPTLRPENNTLTIKYNDFAPAHKYIIEISYTENFCDRAGMLTEKNLLKISSNILRQLPNNSGYIRILQILHDINHRKTILVKKIIGY